MTTRQSAVESEVPASEIANYIIPRIFCVERASSGGSSEGLWKVDVAEGQESGHEAVAARSDAIEPGAGDLGHEAVATKLGDEPGGALATAADISGRWVRVEQRGEIAVTEAVEEMTAVEGGGEESSVVGRDGVEAGDAFVADDTATAQAVELYGCLVGGLNGPEGPTPVFSRLHAELDPQ